jgi:hypothetical protein
VTAADDRANRELRRRHEITRRRMAMIEAGVWPGPKGWADDLLSENYVALRSVSGTSYTITFLIFKTANPIISAPRHPTGDGSVETN